MAVTLGVIAEAELGMAGDDRRPGAGPTLSYVPNIVADEVSVLDTATNTVVATVPVGCFASAFGLFIGQSLPTFSKIFAANPTAARGMSTLTFSITNRASTVAPNLVLTDNLPTGIEIATPNNSTTSCTCGTLTAPAGRGVLSHSDGMVRAVRLALT